MLVVLTVVLVVVAVGWLVTAVVGWTGSPVFDDPLTRDAGRSAQLALAGSLALVAAVLGVASLLRLRSAMAADAIDLRASLAGKVLIGLAALLTWIATLVPFVLSARADGSELTRPMFVNAVLLLVFSLSQAIGLSVAWLAFTVSFRARRPA